MIHFLSDVKSKSIGINTQVWQYSIILEEAKIGANCNINCHVFIENDVSIGDNVTIKSGVQIWDGITIMDDVFVGPNVTFINDKRPRSKKYPPKFQRTIIKSGASIGASSVIFCGIVVGNHSMIGAGSVVTKNVPDRALVYGNPAKIKGWLNIDGSKMKYKSESIWIDDLGNYWEVIDNELTRL